MTRATMPGMSEMMELNRATAYLDPSNGVDVSPTDGTGESTQQVVPEQELPFLKRSSFNARDLMAQDFPPLKQLVDGLIASGMVLLVASPKIGKSWMMLDLSYVAAKGGKALGAIPVERRPVLYMALEDGPRRLQRRLRKLGYNDPPENLEFVVRLDGHDPLQIITTFLDAHRDEQPLVILDTYAKYRAVVPRQAGESEYDRDSRIAANLKDRIDECDGGTLIVVHHTRKMGADDFVETVSGSQGTAGIADEIMKLSRHRGKTEGLLQVSARDAPEGQYKVRFDADTGRWALDGNTLAEAGEAAREYEQTDNTGDMMTSIIKYVNEMRDGVTPKIVDTHFALSSGTASKYLNRAADAQRIVKNGRGKFAPLPA